MSVPGPFQPDDFAAVVAEHWEAVYRLLRSLSGDVHEIDDLVQETFVRALARLDTFRPGTQMRAWLLRIASNAFFDERRRARRRRRAPLIDELPDAGEYEIGSIAMANSGPNTNGSQFFIITGDQGAALPPDYSLFGTVSDGLDTTVADMAAAGTPGAGTPSEPVDILSVRIVQA